MDSLYKRLLRMARIMQHEAWVCCIVWICEVFARLACNDANVRGKRKGGRTIKTEQPSTEIEGRVDEG